jgi:two-component system chemotaxis response regulator CheY
MKARSFDFVVTDWNMPNMDGLDFFMASRQYPALKHVPYLRVTAEAGVNKSWGRIPDQICP